MGLLEKAQGKKQKIEEIESEELSQQKDNLSNIKNDIDKNFLTDSSEGEKDGYTFKNLKNTKFKKEIIEEKKGFGWKGLGTRRITYYHEINEYIYEVSEPILNESEKIINKSSGSLSGSTIYGVRSRL